MVAKNAFLLFAAFSVVYSAPAGFDLEGTTGSPSKGGFDFSRIGSWIGQGQKVIGDAGKSFGDRIKGGMQGQGFLGQGIKNGQDTLQQGQKRFAEGIKHGQDLIGQGIKNGQDAFQQKQKDFGEGIKGGIQQGQDFIGKGMKNAQDAIKKGQEGIKNNVQIGIPKPYNSVRQEP